MIDYIRALRPRHWIKNTIVLAAFFFALGDAEQRATMPPLLESGILVLLTSLLFCVVSSGIYVMNDLRDLELDRMHPQKRLRPIAAGTIPVGTASAMAGALLLASLAGSYFLSPTLARVTAGYILLQVAYSFGLKKIAVLDVLIIATGFVLRALAGAVVIEVHISPWLILCTFLLALFLGFCKRRHEKVLVASSEDENRPSLAKYDEKLLESIISITAASTIVSYSLYTLSPDTVEKFGSAKLGFSIPLVIFGIFRYLDLVYRHEKGNTPERILLTDIPLLIDIALYGLIVLYIFFWSG